MMKDFRFLSRLVGIKSLLASALTVAGYVVFSSLSLCLPLLYSRLLDSAMGGRLRLDLWAFWVAAGLALLAARQYCSYRNALCRLSVQNRLVGQLYHWYSSHLDPQRTAKGVGYYKNFMVKNTQQVVSLLDLSSLGSLLHTLTFFVVTVIVLGIDWVTGLATCLLGVLAVLFHRIGNSHYRRYGKPVQQSRLALFAGLQDTLEGAQTILDFGSAAQEHTRTLQALESLNRREKRLAVFRFLNFFVGLDGCKTAYLLFVVCRSFSLVSQGEMTMALASALILYSQMTSNPIQYLNYALSQLQEGTTALRLLVQELQSPSARPLPPMHTAPFTRLECRELDFSYPGHPVLCRFGATFQAGGHYHLSAPSGGGKTTLLRLLLGQLSPQQGQILVDGKPLSGRLPAGILLQSPTLFEGSLAENICFCPTPDHRARELIAALELQQLEREDFSPATLSGGERSRVLLARALWPDAQMVLLDEPLVGVDRERRDRIIARIRPLLRDKLLLLVTHDPDLAQQLDCQKVQLLP